jgi:hypothetical protein
MIVKEITVSVRQTKNTGNYQNFVAEASVTSQIEEGGSVDLAYVESWKLVKGEVDKQISQAK